MKKYRIGIDPGLTGGVRIFNTEDNTLSVIATPTEKYNVKPTKKKPASKKTNYNIYMMAQVLYPIQNDIGLVVIEEVAARPGQGVTSMFRFGYGLGLWHGIIAAYRLPYMTVTPQKWKAKFDLIGGEKEDSRRVASELFPKCSEAWKLKKHDGLAEAALLGYYGILFESVEGIDNPEYVKA